MRAKKIFEKFVEDSDPIKDMGIGIRNQILADLKKYNISEKNVKITDDNDLYWVGNKWNRPDKFKELQLKYFSPEKRKFAKHIIDMVANRNTELLEQYIQEAIDDGIEKTDIELLLSEFGNEPLISKSHIILTKLSRDEEQIDYEDMVNIYVFIGYTEKVPITIKGKQYYEDRLQAESVNKIDKYNTGDLQSISMMKLRAKIQYGGEGNVYMVHVPKFMMDKDYYDSIPEEHREFIEEHKQRI